MTAKFFINQLFGDNGILSDAIYYPIVERESYDVPYPDLEDAENIWLKEDTFYSYGSIKDHHFIYYDGFDSPVRIMDKRDSITHTIYISFNEGRTGPHNITINEKQNGVLIRFDDFVVFWDMAWNNRYDLLGKDFCKNPIDKIAIAVLKNRPHSIKYIEHVLSE